MLLDQIFYYTRFHEVLIFDCITRTNCHNIVLYLFLIVNNNIRQLKKVSNDFYLRVIYTDCDPIMANTISFVYPIIKHNLYIFYINLNLKKKFKTQT